jgi:hypothetical protein
LTEEWFWASVICAIPFLVFGAIEALAVRRRRRMEAIGRRSKSKVRGW